MSNLLPIPAFDDNYIWLLHDGRSAVVVDPGDAAPVQDALAQYSLTLVAILLTHHHSDHSGGIAALCKHFQVPVFGPGNSPALALVSKPLLADDTLDVGSWHFRVIGVPGHTLDHVAFYCPRENILFCGDTLFSGGCGRVFEGTYEQMHASLQKLAVLPGETQVCCAHEYTLSNLRFGVAAEPGNDEIRDYLKRCEQLRNENKPTLPSTIGMEKKINTFLRCSNPTEFAEKREWKNRF